MGKCKICHKETKWLTLEMCTKHYNQYKKYGHCLDTNPRTIYDLNEIVEYKDYAEIILYDKNCNEKCRALIDLDDVEKVKNIKWCLKSNGYVHNGKVYLHRIIMDVDDNVFIDHINRNKLDNRKSNLRICTRQQNNFNRGKRTDNTSGFSGVDFYKRENKWRARIQVDYEEIVLGLFSTKEEAIKVRKEAEIKYFGEYRNKNN